VIVKIINVFYSVPSFRLRISVAANATSVSSSGLPHAPKVGALGSYTG
jgi:hypothetical protein